MPELANRIITGIALICVLLIVLFLPSKLPFILLMLIILAIILIKEWPRLFSPYSKNFWLLMAVYPIAPFVLVILLHNYSAMLTLFLIIGVSVFDTGSYIFGKLFGRHKILPTVSPGKSWEGFIGGYCGALLFAYIVFNSQANMLSTCFFMFVFCTIALFGDLFESALKRRAHIKDSGSILPGHGGLLDRFDGILSTVFLVYAYKEQLLKILEK